MTWAYGYTSHIGPILISTTFLVALGIYCIRRRTAPGAFQLSILAALVILWVLANGLELAGTDDAAKVFWFKFQTALMIPIATAALCFVLEYAGLGKWLTKRAVALSVILTLSFILLILTDGIHHLVWVRIWFENAVHAVPGPAHRVAVGYVFFLSVLQLMVLAWLFGRSPRHRWIVGGLIAGSVSMRGAAFLNIANWNPIEPLDPMLLGLNFSLLMYALGIVRFRMFEVVPVARDSVIERMADGLMILDTESRIADINEAARRLLGLVSAKTLGREASMVLETYPDLSAFIDNPGENRCELSFGAADASSYQIWSSPIIDRRGFCLGRLIMMHDITEQKRAQARLLDQERALAMLRERELLARELHDGIGQMAAAAHLQVKIAGELLARGDTASVGSCLDRLADATQEVKQSIREYLQGVKTGSPKEDQDLVTGLRKYMDQYSQQCGIQTELVVPPDLERVRFGSMIEAQLQPIIQEALINVRRHSGASCARVIFAHSGSRVRVTIEDDGRGFDPEALGGSESFGLRSMRGRAESLGGTLEISSTPGKGTLVSIEIPCRKEKK